MRGFLINPSRGVITRGGYNSTARPVVSSWREGIWVAQNHAIAPYGDAIPLPPPVRRMLRAPIWQTTSLKITWDGGWRFNNGVSAITFLTGLRSISAARRLFEVGGAGKYTERGSTITWHGSIIPTADDTLRWLWSWGSVTQGIALGYRFVGGNLEIVSALGTTLRYLPTAGADLNDIRLTWAFRGVTVLEIAQQPALFAALEPGADYIVLNDTVLHNATTTFKVMGTISDLYTGYSTRSQLQVNAYNGVMYSSFYSPATPRIEYVLKLHKDLYAFLRIPVIARKHAPTTPTSYEFLASVEAAMTTNESVMEALDADYDVALGISYTADVQPRANFRADVQLANTLRPVIEKTASFEATI